MSKDTYTYKEILLGLRPQLLQTKQLLDELKGLSTSDQKKIRDYFFYLHQSLDDKRPNPELMISFKKEQSALMELIQRLKKAAGYRQPTATPVLRNNNSEYFPANRRDCRVAVKHDKKEEFDTVARIILDSASAKETNFSVNYLPSYGEPESVRIANYGVEARRIENHQIQSLTYKGREDAFVYRAPKTMPLTNDELQRLLSIEVPKVDLPPYHQILLETSEDLDKEIVLTSMLSPTNFVKLDVKEDGKQLLLTRQTPSAKTK